MKRNPQEEKKELKQYGFNDQNLPLLYALIDIDDFERHTKARSELVKSGQKILPMMHTLLQSDYLNIRKAAIKVIEQIAHESSIQEMIRMLEDRESEIRWIAGEALIKIGKKSIKPLLKALVEEGTSYYLQQGARHVLVALVSENDSKELKQLVNLLKYEINLPAKVPVDAAKALENYT